MLSRGVYGQDEVLYAMLVIAVNISVMFDLIYSSE